MFLEYENYVLGLGSGNMILSESPSLKGFCSERNTTVHNKNAMLTLAGSLCRIADTNFLMPPGMSSGKEGNSLGW